MLKDNKLADDLIEEKQANIFYCDLVGNSPYGIKEIFQKMYQYLNLMKVIKDGELFKSEEIYTQSLLEEIKKSQLLMKNSPFLKQRQLYLMNFNQKKILLPLEENALIF